MSFSSKNHLTIVYVSVWVEFGLETNIRSIEAPVTVSLDLFDYRLVHPKAGSSKFIGGGRKKRIIYWLASHVL